MEYPILLGVVALYFVIRGSGPWSVDHKILDREL
jgi:uncharacterized membrane protein YphA (DoxX/SURF4 family)